MKILLAPLFALAVAGPGIAADAGEVAHRRGICSEIVKIDLLLYSNPTGHGSTARCSYTADRLLITPAHELPEERMNRFVLLAFLATGALRNDDYRLPDNVYVGYGSRCQVMSTYHASILQSDARSPGNSGLVRSAMSASQAKRVPCPK